MRSARRRGNLSAFRETQACTHSRRPSAGGQRQRLALKLKLKLKFYREEMEMAVAMVAAPTRGSAVERRQAKLVGGGVRGGERRAMDRRRPEPHGRGVGLGGAQAVEQARAGHSHGHGRGVIDDRPRPRLECTTGSLHSPAVIGLGLVSGYHSSEVRSGSATSNARSAAPESTARRRRRVGGGCRGGLPGRCAVRGARCGVRGARGEGSGANAHVTNWRDSLLGLARAAQHTAAAEQGVGAGRRPRHGERRARAAAGGRRGPTTTGARGPGRGDH